MNFSENDLASFEEAQIDGELLHEHFLQKNKIIDDQVMLLVRKHTKLFGYIKQNPVQYYRNRLAAIQRCISEETFQELQTLIFRLRAFQEGTNGRHVSRSSLQYRMTI